MAFGERFHGEFAQSAEHKESVFLEYVGELGGDYCIVFAMNLYAVL